MAKGREIVSCWREKSENMCGGKSKSREIKRVLDGSVKWEVVLVNKLTCVENKVDKRMGIMSSLVLSRTILVFLPTPSDPLT